MTRTIFGSCAVAWRLASCALLAAALLLPARALAVECADAANGNTAAGTGGRCSTGGIPAREGEVLL